MRRLVVGAIGARTAFRLAVPVALVAAGAGAVAAAPAAAAAHGPAAQSCTVNWIGSGFGGHNRWTTASNWSTGKVPGPNDDVCIGNNPAGTGVIVLTPVSITIHSLQIRADQGIAFEGTASSPVTATVATSVTIASGGRIDMTDATIKAAQITNQGGTISTDGTCNLTSPGVSFTAGGDLQAANGTATLTSLANLSNGTLTGVSLTTAGATVVLPGDISHLVSANLSLGQGFGTGSAVEDPAGHNALTDLASVDSQSSLLDDSNLTLASSSFTASGNVTLGGGVVAIGGPYTQAGGTLALGSGTTIGASQVTIAQGAFLSGGGTLAEDLVNDGTVIAGPATKVSGNYTQAAGANLVSGFTGSPTGGGLLAVTGTATLAGSVTATELLTRTFDTTQLITFGSLSGGFTSHNLGLKLVTRANEIDAIVVPQLAVTPKTVAPGHAVTLSGGGFTYPQTVRIFLDHARGTPLATTGVGIRGTFMATVTIPKSATAGTHRLIAVETDGIRSSTTITVR